MNANRYIVRELPDKAYPFVLWDTLNNCETGNSYSTQERAEQVAAKVNSMEAERD